MEIIRQLNDLLLSQDFSADEYASNETLRLQILAMNYARVENAIAVLSDMRTNSSIIVYGGFAQRIGLSTDSTSYGISSIWEKEILERIHSDDLNEKYILELRYFQFIKHISPSIRNHYYLAEKLRMKDSNGKFIQVLHRMFYLSAEAHNSIRYALCLYTPLTTDFPSGGRAVNTISGEMRQMDDRNDKGILSSREKQVLSLISKGMLSKDIAEKLFISINTVSRHRQKILQKLQVNNSIEACKIAKELGLI